MLGTQSVPEEGCLRKARRDTTAHLRHRKAAMLRSWHLRFEKLQFLGSLEYLKQIFEGNIK